MRMARFPLMLCIFVVTTLVAAIPIHQGVQGRDEDYVRNPLSDWDTPLPVRDDEEVAPVPQQDLKL